MIRSLPLLMWLACTPAPSSLGDKDDAPGDLDLVGILINPESVIIPVGQSIQLRATGLSADRTSTDVTAAADWQSSDEAVAVVRQGLDAEGQIEGLSVGSAEVSATLTGVSSVPLRVKVTDAALDSLSVSPERVTVGVGQSIQLSATASFSDGASSDASAQVRWITADGGVVKLDQGLLSGSGVGTTTVYADWDGVRSAEVLVEVIRSAQPDLALLGVEAVASGGYLLAEIAVANQGDAGAADFWLDLFIDPTTTPGVGDVGQVYGTVGYLEPGTSALYYLDLDGVSDGVHQLVAFVDAEGAVDESDESNNRGQTSVSMEQATPLGPDLTVQSLDYLTDGTDILYDLVIKNRGEAPSGGFYVDIFIDQARAPQVGDYGDSWEYVDDLAPGASLNLDPLVSAAGCFSCSSWVLVDSADDVSETNEANNTASVEVYAGGDSGLAWR